jgi:hypothetical protein
MRGPERGEVGVGVVLMVVVQRLYVKGVLEESG